MPHACRPLTAWRRSRLPVRAAALVVCASALAFPPLATGQTCGAPSFGAAPTASLPAAPSGVAVGDFNRDGQQDAAVVDASGQLQVLLGDGTGALALQPPQGSLALPADVVAADLDRNGTLDLAVATGSSTVALLSGNGDGTFEAQTPLDLGVAPTRLAVADMNRDGRPDIVVVGGGGDTVALYFGGGGFSFPSSLTLAPATPSAVAVGDFNRDGWPDLAVAQASANQVQIYTGKTSSTAPFVAFDAGPALTASSPLDIATGDVDRDGKLDLVTVDGAGIAETFTGNDLSGFDGPQATSIGSGLTRLALTDFDRDGLLDLVVLDKGALLVTVVPGKGAPAFDDARAASVALSALSAPVALALGDFDKDGRPDAVAVGDGASPGPAAVVGVNTSGPDCPAVSFADAPRAFAAGDGPIASAAADMDEDGTPDLVVAAGNLPTYTIEVLRGSGGLYQTSFSTSITPAPPRGVAVADFDTDGHQDVVVAVGSSSIGQIQLFRGDGLGGLVLPGVTFSTGLNASAVVTGDFDGNGTADVAVTNETANQVQVFRGDGTGGFVLPPTSIALGAGSLPRALAAGDVDGNGTLDLVVANSGTGTVTVLLGAGDGTTFAAGPNSPLPVGAGPWGVALGDFDGIGGLDLVTADHDAVPPTVTVRLGSGNGDFPTSATYDVGAAAFAVAAADVTGDGNADVSAVTSNQALEVFAGDGAGRFAPAPAVVPVRNRPSAITPLDADGDGVLDLAVPCKDADSIVVLLGRPPGFSQAARVTVGKKPSAAVAADLDADGDLDLAVVNTDDNTVTVLTNDGFGVLTVHATLDTGASPQGIVVADLTRDGVPDLAVSNGVSGTVSVFRGTGGADFAAGSSYPAGSNPDDLAAGDFDGDGDLDLAVCNKVASGAVQILTNNGSGVFGPGTAPAVGTDPSGIAVADLDRNGTLDIAVANNGSKNVTVLSGNGAGGFSTAWTLPLDAADTAPVAVVATDLDGDGDLDLVAVATSTNAVNVFERDTGTGTYKAPVRHPTPYLPTGLVASDVNRDGVSDLVLSSDAVQVLRGKGTLDLQPAEAVVAGKSPAAVAVGDFDGDGRPDLAVPNSLSNDVSIVLNTACRARRLVVATSPGGCVISAPFSVSAVVEARDDGGNPAVCAAGSVLPSFESSPVGATLEPPDGVDLTNGRATFSDLTISPSGGHYRLRFDLSGVGHTHTRSFTLGPSLAITGPSVVCNASPASHSVDPIYDSYLWTTDGTPYGFTPSVTLTSPPLAIDTTYLLEAESRIDSCDLSAGLSVHLASALASVTAAPTGSTMVCVDCLGGMVTAAEAGGGPAASRQWGYRTAPGPGPITPILGQTSPSYVVNGLDFPGPGTYYLVETTQPTCGPTLTSNEVTIDIEPAVPGGEVRSLGVTSRDSGGVGENVLQWVNTTPVAGIRIRWNQATLGSPFCSPPATATGTDYDGQMDLGASAQSRDSWPHTGLRLDTAYCYSVFSFDGINYSPGRTVRGYPFDTSGPEKWAYYTGATAVVPPVVTFPGLIAMSNDRSVHALERGISGGLWPALWTPRLLTGIVHSRSPVVPLSTPVNGASTVLFVGDDAGDVVAVDAVSGTAAWGPVTPFPNLPDGSAITGAPGGTFVRYGGPTDAIVVEIRSNTTTPGSASRLVALRLADGTVASAFDGLGTPGAGLGPVSGTPAIDNAGGYVYLGSRRLDGTGDSLWCLHIDAAGALSYVWSLELGDIDTSPVIRGGRLYIANTAGTIYSVDLTGNPAEPTDIRSYSNPDGQVKGFLFPNRQTDELFFASNSSVRSLSDTAGGFSLNWTWSPAGLEPSIVLFWPQTTYVYVGAQDGRLYQLDFSGGAPGTTCVPASEAAASCMYLALGDGLGHVGAPSLDIGLLAPDEVSPGKAMIYVGSESGGLHAVEVPFP